MSRHHLLAVVALGQQRVVSGAQHCDIFWRVVAAAAKGLAVVELEPIAGLAASSTLVDVCAPSSVALVNGTSDRRRDVT